MSALRLQRDGSSHKSLGFIIALCAGWFGLQQIFTVFYASGYFYLASLGFSDTLISFTWLSGPIAGMFFQPFVGTLSDKCTHPWGKRRPFIVAGTAMLIASMLSLAWAEEIATAFSGAPVREARAPGGQEEDVLSWELYVFATVCTVAANFSIQPVQLGLRAMIVDLVPSQQQAQAHAWVSKVNLAGSIAGYGIGAVDLRQNLRFLGETQLQILCALVSLNLVVCISITCYLVQEKRPSKLEFEGHRQSARTSALSILGYLRDFPVTRQVCLAQIFCWLAWFPFLFYFAKYITGLRIKASSYTGVEVSVSALEDRSRNGSFAMLIFSFTSLASAVVLSWLAKMSSLTTAVAQLQNQYTSGYLGRQVFSLRRIWLAGQVLLGLCMLSTLVITSVNSAYVLVALAGVPWAAGTWIPFALISKEIRRSSGPVLGTAAGVEGGDLAATIVGLHNSAICAPQIAAALGSSLLFLVVGSQGSPGIEAWLLGAGGLSALAAAWVIKKMPDDSQVPVQVTL